jgi:hypothetical protein
MTRPSSIRADRLLALMRRVVVRHVLTAEDQDDVAVLRYRAYRAAGMIGPISAQRLWDGYDEMPNQQTVAVWSDARPIASIRLHIAEAANGGRSPAIAVFPDVLEPRLADGDRIVDPNRLTVDPVA